jgi:hypothetical protein
MLLSRNNLRRKAMEEVEVLFPIVNPSILFSVSRVSAQPAGQSPPSP